MISSPSLQPLGEASTRNLEPPQQTPGVPITIAFGALQLVHLAQVEPVDNINRTPVVAILLAHPVMVPPYPRTEAAVTPQAAASSPQLTQAIHTIILEVIPLV